MHDLYGPFYKNSNYLLAFTPGFPMGVEQRLGNTPGFYTNLQKLKDLKLNSKDYADVYHTEVKKQKEHLTLSAISSILLLITD